MQTDEGVSRKEGVTPNGEERKQRKHVFASSDFTTDGTELIRVPGTALTLVGGRGETETRVMSWTTKTREADSRVETENKRTTQVCGQVLISGSDKGR